MQTELTQLGALISVYHKAGIDRLLQALHRTGYLLHSSDGTAKHIRGLDLPVKEVSEYTGFPEMMGGRLKTLHPMIYGSILGRTGEMEDLQNMQKHGMLWMNVVVVNLYPFQAEVAKGEATTHEKIIEKIDIGGPSMLRAAAKNYERVSVICDPADYDVLAAMLESGIEIPLSQREKWAQKVFAMTKAYDTAIEEYYASRTLAGTTTQA